MSTHDRRDPPPGEPTEPDIPDPRGPAWDLRHHTPRTCSYYSEDGTVVYDPDNPLGWIESTKAYVRKKTQ